MRRILPGQAIHIRTIELAFALSVPECEIDDELSEMLDNPDTRILDWQYTDCGSIAVAPPDVVEEGEIFTVQRYTPSKDLA